MGYGDLLRALEEEVREQARALREAARADGERLAAEGRSLAARAREEALTRLSREREASLARARARAALAEDRVLLAEKRRLLEELRSEVASRLVALSSPALTVRLLEKALGDDDGSPLRAVVDPGHAAACREYLARSHSAAVARTEIVEAAEARGGVELFVGSHLTVDDTLAARLSRAWPRLEVELSPVLFGGDDGAQ
ncbi:MAG TPA: hypothetical protein VMT17_05675 [Anaeromyxobacteraceae bacterium]|nr:hypothetical protein [Anaeromyxobacteraceae bacterium]